MRGGQAGRPPYSVFAKSVSLNRGARKKRSPPDCREKLPPPTNQRPSGENTSPRNAPPSRRTVRSSCCVATFQNLRVLSSLAVASVLPSGAKATESTPCLCPVQVPIGLPVATSSNRIVSSEQATASSLPSAENATADSNPSCASTVRFVRRECDATSQSSIVLPRDNEARVRPSREKRLRCPSVARTVFMPLRRSQRRRFRPRPLVRRVPPSGERTTSSTGRSD